MRSILFCLFITVGVGATPAVVAQEAEASVCVLVPDACAVQGSETAGGFTSRPEIEYNVCDIWPELCAVGDADYQVVDLCVLAPTLCDLRDRDLGLASASAVYEQRSSELCRLNPDACVVAGGDLPNVSFPLCDAAPGVCDRSSVDVPAVLDLDPCVLAPDRCEIVDLNGVLQSFQELEF